MGQRGSVIVSAYTRSPPWSHHQQKGHSGSGPASLIHTLFCAEQQKGDTNGRVSLVSCFSDPNELRSSDSSLRRIAQFHLQGQLITLTRTTQRCVLQVFQWTGKLERYKAKQPDGFLFSLKLDWFQELPFTLLPMPFVVTSPRCLNSPRFLH